MKNLLARLFLLTILLSSMTVQAKDTSDIRKDLLKARASIDLALEKLDQTSFSETKRIFGESPCASNSSSARVQDTLNFVTNRSMAKCGTDCSVAVSYSAGTNGNNIYFCEITAVASKE